MKSENLTRASGFVVAADEGQPFWFLNTLTITKVGSDQCGGQLSIVDHRVAPGFAPPPHLHHHSGEALLILDGQLDGFCGDHSWLGRARLAATFSCPARSRTVLPPSLFEHPAAELSVDDSAQLCEDRRQPRHIA